MKTAHHILLVVCVTLLATGCVPALRTNEQWFRGQSAFLDGNGRPYRLVTPEERDTAQNTKKLNPIEYAVQLGQLRQVIRAHRGTDSTRGVGPDGIPPVERLRASGIVGEPVPDTHISYMVYAQRGPPRRSLMYRACLFRHRDLLTNDVVETVHILRYVRDHHQRPSSCATRLPSTLWSDRRPVRPA